MRYTRNLFHRRTSLTVLYERNRHSSVRIQWNLTMRVNFRLICPKLEPQNEGDFPKHADNFVFCRIMNSLKRVKPRLSLWQEARKILLELLQADGRLSRITTHV